MIVYHGTTVSSALRIRREGFRPRKPSKRVWFTRSVGYARGRAKAKARRAKDRATILSCEIDLPKLRNALGPRRIFVHGSNIAIDAEVAADVLRSQPSVPGEPSSPTELAAWVNEQIRRKSYKGVKPRDPGVIRLAKWVVNRVTERKGKYPRARELFEMARRYLPDWFIGCVFDPERARVQRIVNLGTISVRRHGEPERISAREGEALDCLGAARPRRRVRGLELLRDLDDPDLFEWCMMFLDDPSPQVKAGAARIMLDCKRIDREALAPLADSPDRIVRAGALAALSRHEGPEDPEWFEMGLRDPEAHVRVATARQLAVLKAFEHRSLIELALYDPNPKVAAEAEKAAKGTGIGRRY